MGLARRDILARCYGVSSLNEVVLLAPWSPLLTLSYPPSVVPRVSLDKVDITLFCASPTQLKEIRFARGARDSSHWSFSYGMAKSVFIYSIFRSRDV